MTSDSQLHVLLVEENAPSAEFIQTQLAQSTRRFEVFRFETLTEALAQPPMEEHVVLLLSLTLQDVAGTDAITAARQRVPDATVIAIVQDSCDEAAVACVQSGADDCLVRGEFDQRVLIRTISLAVQRHQTNQRAKEERYLFRRLIDDLPDQVYAKDLDGRFVVVNRAIRQFFGLARDEQIIGKTDFDLLPHDAAMGFQQEERELSQLEKTTIDRESTIASPNGSPGQVWMRTTKVPMRDEYGRVVGIAGINRDITERKQFRDALEQSNAELAERQKTLIATMAALEQSHEELRAAQLHLVQAEKMESIGRLAAGVAHEIKNPLSVALMCGEYLSRLGLTNPKVGPVLNTLTDAIHRADVVVHGLLDFATPGAVALTDASIENVVRRSLVLVRHELLRAHVSVRNELPPALPQLLIDVAKIEQVLINVFMNAVHAMPEGGTITISCSEGKSRDAQQIGAEGRSDTGCVVPSRTLMLFIDDTGTGIANCNLTKIFEPFFTTMPVGKGSGLGLTVSDTIMKLHGGSISLENRPAGGARVTLLFNLKGD